MNDQSTPRLTVLTSAQESVEFVGKLFTLQGDGSIAKTAAGNVWRWDGVVRLAPTAAGLARGLSNLNQNQAIALGTPAVDPGEPFLIGHGIRRTLDHFHHAEGPGWLLLDFDNGAMPPTVAQRIREMGGVLAALERVWPELRTATRVARYSSSAGVHRVGDPAPDLSDDVALGRHVFVLLQDQRQAKAALEALTLRAFALGLGWIKLSASGGLLVRSIVDGSVSSPERLVFCGPPDLGEGLARTVPPPEWQEGVSLDAPTPPPGQFATDEILRLKAEAAPQAAQVQRAWSKDQARRVMAATGCSAREAIRAVRERLDGGTLDDRFVLDLADGTRSTVGELLDRLEAKIEAEGLTKLTYALPSPIEGRAYGATTASILWSDKFAHAVLIDHAHGARSVYRFERYEPGAAKARPVTLPALPGTGEGRAALRAAVGGFVARAKGWVARGQGDALTAVSGAAARPFELLNVGVGIGKTHQAIQALAELVAKLNADEAEICEMVGDPVPKRGKFAGIFAAPTHELLAQIGRDFEALCIEGIKIVHLRGPKALDPDAPVDDPKRTMCRRAPALVMAGSFLQDTRKVCSSCALKQGCSYRANQRQIGTIYLITHAELALGRTAPPVLARRGQTLAAVVIDEDASGSMIRTADTQKLAAATADDDGLTMTLRLDALQQAPIDTQAALGGHGTAAVMGLLNDFLKDRRGAGPAPISGPIVRRVREAIYHAARASFAAQGRNGPAFMDMGLLAAAMRARGLSPEDLQMARVEEWARRVVLEDVKGLELQDYIEQAGSNLTVRPAQSAYAELARALQAQGWDEWADFAAPPQISGRNGRVRVVEHAKHGLSLQVAGLAKLGNGYSTAPTLLLDATADVALVERIWGVTPSVTTVRVAEPNLRVAQDFSRTGSKRMMTGATGSAADIAAAERWREKLVRWLKRLLEQHPEGVLLACNKSVEDGVRAAFGADTPLPFAVAHFNNMRGRNDFQHLTAVVVLGRTLPASEAVAATIEALTAEVVEGRDDLIKQGTVERLAVAGDGHAMVPGVGPTCEDPLAHALMAQISGAECEQAIGRLRAVQRPGTALTAYVLSDVVLERPVELVTDMWDDIKAAGVVAAQLDQGDVAFLTSAHAFRAYRRAELRPGVPLWRNDRAAEKAFERDEQRRELLEAVGAVCPATSRHFSIGSIDPDISQNPLYREMSGSGDDGRIAGIDPRRFYLGRYFSPRSPKASFALIRCAALGEGPLSSSEEKAAIAAMIRAMCGFEPRDLMLHNDWGPQLDGAFYAEPSTKRLIIAAPSGLLADLTPMRRPAAPVRSRYCLQTGLRMLCSQAAAGPRSPAQRAASPVHAAANIITEMLAAYERLHERGPRAA